MSSTRAAPSTGDTGQTVADQSSQPESATVYRVVAEWVLSLYPTARNLRIVGDVPDPSGSSVTFRLPVPTSLDPDPDEIDGAIMAVLAGLKPGHKMSGAVLAMSIDENLDHTAGTFRRSVRRLKSAGRIDSDRTGYWLKS